MKLNKENKFPHLELWCKEYYATVGLKVHPANVPTDVLIDEILGKISALTLKVNMIFEMSTTQLQLLAEHEKTDSFFLEKIIALEDRCAKLEDTLINQPTRKAKESKKVKV